MKLPGGQGHPLNSTTDFEPGREAKCNFGVGRVLLVFALVVVAVTVVVVLDVVMIVGVLVIVVGGVFLVPPCPWHTWDISRPRSSRNCVMWLTIRKQRKNLSHSEAVKQFSVFVLLGVSCFDFW